MITDYLFTFIGVVINNNSFTFNSIVTLCLRKITYSQYRVMGQIFIFFLIYPIYYNKFSFNRSDLFFWFGMIFYKLLYIGSTFLCIFYSSFISFRWCIFIGFINKIIAGLLGLIPSSFLHYVLSCPFILFFYTCTYHTTISSGTSLYVSKLLEIVLHSFYSSVIRLNVKFFDLVFFD